MPRARLTNVILSGDYPDCQVISVYLTTRPGGSGGLPGLSLFALLDAGRQTAAKIKAHDAEHNFAQPH